MNKFESSIAFLHKEIFRLRDVVEQHGGKILVENNFNLNGAGETSFIIRIPVGRPGTRPKSLPVSVPLKTAEAEAKREFLNRLRAVMKANHSDPEFGVEQLAEKLCISSAGLYRKVRAATGRAPSDYIRFFRLQRAARLLSGGSVSIGDIAFAVGFGSHTYFTRCFKETFDCLPSEYKMNSSGRTRRYVNNIES